MSDFTFRIKFKLAEECSINVNAPKIDITLPNIINHLTLSSYEDEKNISDVKNLILTSSGWSSNQEAEKAGKQWINTLKVTFAILRIGVDFSPIPQGFVHPEGLKIIGQGRRSLNDQYGLMTYESEPAPLFISTCATGEIRKPWDRIENTLNRVGHCSPELSDKHQLSIELFHASFFAKSPITRFLFLVIAIEALLEPQLRTELARSHVEHLIELTMEHDSLSKQEKNSLRGTLEYLLKESITQTGCKLAESWLGDKKYMDREASNFFKHCYNIRSKLVHGNDAYSSDDEVRKIVDILEEFVSDLLCKMLGMV